VFPNFRARSEELQVLRLDPAVALHDRVAQVAQLSCLLEASVPKPGNVSPFRAFADMDYLDFVKSAVAIGPVMAQAAREPVGLVILRAVREVRRWTQANTNLGTVLLLAPLARAACLGGALRQRLSEVLRDLTVEDARWTYEAIRLANPGGLGRVEAQDVWDTPTVTLREAMRLAAERDAVAREYVTDYAITFQVGAPSLREARSVGLRLPTAVVFAFLRILGEVPDTLIARRRGPQEAQEASRRAREVLACGDLESKKARARLRALDRWLCRCGNARNPGTTADLVCAALFAVLWEDGIAGWRWEG
jgi:triphosphoribosyl-dephospho-CoA synthase